MTVSPPCSYYERDSLGGGSEVATPAFVSQSGFPTSPSVPDCRASAIGVAAGPPIQLLEGSHSTSAGTGNPPAGPCNLITRFDGWEVIIPLQFIPMEDI